MVQGQTSPAAGAGPAMTSQTTAPTSPDLTGAHAAGASGRTQAHPPTHTQAGDDPGWAMIPHTIASDIRLSAVDARVVFALLYFTKSKATCTPCDKSIAARAGG